MSNILETFPKGSGHKILNSDGTALTQENNLQIVGFDITDEAGDKATKVAPANLNADSLDDITSGNIRTGIVTPAMNYSTNEQIVGRWIDGKPLYQKTVQTNRSFTEQWTTFTNIPNIEKVINAIIHVKENSNNTYGIRTDYYVEVSGTNGDVGVFNHTGYTVPVEYITIQYTKTTD